MLLVLFLTLVHVLVVSLLNSPISKNHPRVTRTKKWSHRTELSFWFHNDWGKFWRSRDLDIIFSGKSGYWWLVVVYLYFEGASGCGHISKNPIYGNRNYCCNSHLKNFFLSFGAIAEKLQTNNFTRLLNNNKVTIRGQTRVFVSYRETLLLILPAITKADKRDIRKSKK